MIAIKIVFGNIYSKFVGLLAVSNIGVASPPIAKRNQQFLLFNILAFRSERFK